MRCALCPNEENLLIEVKNHHSLTLCSVCENSLEYPHFEVAARLAVENEKLREHVEKMKNCQNCRYAFGMKDPCWNCINNSKWEIDT